MTFETAAFPPNAQKKLAAVFVDRSRGYDLWLDLGFGPTEQHDKRFDNHYDDKRCDNHYDDQSEWHHVHNSAGDRLHAGRRLRTAPHFSFRHRNDG
jgi:hypothetical protein